MLYFEELTLCPTNKRYDKKKHLEINLQIDSQSAIKLIKSGEMNRRSKHIDVSVGYHFISEKLDEGFTIQHCPSEFQLADYPSVELVLSITLPEHLILTHTFTS